MNRRQVARRSIVALVAAAAAFAGCGDEPESGPSSVASDSPAEAATVREPEPALSTTEAGRTEPRPAPLVQARCPAGLSNCKTASGEVIYVERVDPDGDGDAHFVLLSRQSITAAGISVIDVEAGLRPHPLPGVGARISAAGPVYEGSHGQLQIQAIELRVAPGSG